MLETIATLGTGAIQRVQIPLSETALMGGVNVHLLTGPEGLVVLDFGPPGALAAPIWQRLLPHIQGFDGPVRLLASHMHGDHIGMALPVARAVGVGLEMAAPEWAEAALRLEREGAGHATVEADFLSACGILAPLPCQQKPLEVRLPPRGPNLLAGQTLRMAGAEWQAVMTPGHSAAMTCFHQAEADLILSGDTLLPGVVPVTRIFIGTTMTRWAI